MSNKPKKSLNFGLWTIVTEYGDVAHFPDKKQAFDWYKQNSEICYGKPFPTRVGNKDSICNLLNMHSFKDTLAIPCFGLSDD